LVDEIGQFLARPAQAYISDTIKSCPYGVDDFRGFGSIGMHNLTAGKTCRRMSQSFGYFRFGSTNRNSLVVNDDGSQQGAIDRIGVRWRGDKRTHARARFDDNGRCRREFKPFAERPIRAVGRGYLLHCLFAHCNSPGFLDFGLLCLTYMGEIRGRNCSPA